MFCVRLNAFMDVKIQKEKFILFYFIFTAFIKFVLCVVRSALCVLKGTCEKVQKYGVLKSIFFLENGENFRKKCQSSLIMASWAGFFLGFFILFLLLDP